MNRELVSTVNHQNLSVVVKFTHEGVIVDVWGESDEGDPLGTLGVMYTDDPAWSKD